MRIRSMATAIKELSGQRCVMSALLATLSAPLLISTAPAAAPGEARSVTYSLDIPAQDLNSALQEFALASQHRLFYKSELVEGKMSQALKGEFTMDEAVRRLLAGTALTYDITPSEVVLIRHERDTPAALRNGSDDRGSIVLAQSDTPAQQSKAESESSLDAQSGDVARLEEVVVTAQKRQERLKDVPISISVLGGEQLDSNRGAGLLEALASVPGVTIRENAQGSTTSLAIRGVTATSPLFVGSSPIGFYLDSLPFGLVRSAAVPDVNPFDLDRVEVLRGPQGTLYGASSLNGVVRVLTKDPDLSAFDFKGRTSASSTREGGTNYRGDAAFNAPIVMGKLAARVVAGYQNLDGWIDTPNRENVNDAQVSNVRVKVKAQPTDDFSVGLTAWRSRSDLGAASISDDQFRRISDAREPNDTGFDTYNLTANYDFAAVTLSSMTSYLRFSTESLLSLDAAAPGLPFFDTDVSGKTFSQEFVLNSKTEGNWRWSAGAFYREAEETLFQIYAGQDNTDKSRSLAFFGQVSRMLMNERLEVSLGLRHFEDEVSNEDNPGPVNTTPPFYKISDKFDKLSPKAVVTWRPNTDVSIYASYGEGFRSGFSQIKNVIRLAPEFAPMGPDKLTNYELGTKASLARGKLEFEAAGFFIDWRDTQQIIIVRDDDTLTGFPAGVNVGKVDGYGVDLALRTRPVRGLELAVSYNWNDLAFRTPIFSNGAILFEKGMRPTSSVEETLGGSVLYSAPVRNGWAARFETSANYTSALTDLSLVGGVPFSQSGDPILMVRSSLSLEAPSHWTLTAFAENLTDTRHLPSRNFGVEEWTSRLRPRTIGVELEYRFR